MSLSVVTLGDPPLSLDELKQQLRIATTDGETSVDDDDSLLNEIIATACDSIESYTGRCLRPATYTLTLDCFPDGDDPVIVPRPPLKSVASIQYYDSSDNSQNYTGRIDTKTIPGRVFPTIGESWPATFNRHDAVTITFSCGYDLADVPPRIRQAMRLFGELEYDDMEPAKATRIEKRIQTLVRGLVIRNSGLKGTGT